MYKPKLYKPVFIKDAITNMDQNFSCYGTILTLHCSNSPRQKPTVLTIDDGTGSLPAVYFDVQQVVTNNIDVGCDVIVYGHVQVYRQDLQFKCDRIKIVKDPDIQTLWINQVLLAKNKDQ